MIEETNKIEFNDISKAFDNVTFYQTSNWALLKAYTGWKALYLVYKEDNNIKACGLFLLKKMPFLKSYMAYCPRGFLIDFNDYELLKRFNSELIAYLKNKKVFELIIDPYVLLNHRDIDGKIIDDGFDNQKVISTLTSIGYRHTGYNLYYENLQPRFLFRLKLKDKTIDEIYKGFKKEAKRRANKKDFFGIRVRELKEDEISIFKDLMNKTSLRKGFIDRPLDYYKQMYKALAKDKILHYMVAEIDIEKAKHNILYEITIINKRIEKLKEHALSNKGRIKEENVTIDANQKLLKQLEDLEKEKGKVVPLSVVCLLTYGKEAIMLLAGNDEKYLQHFNSSNIIVAELIKLCKEKGFDYYNFYGISGDFNSESPYYGLYTYKRQYGGEVVELIGQFEYVINSFIKHIYDIMLRVYKLTKK